RHTAGWELMAQACLALEQHDESVRVLREGTAAVPTAWGLWQMLGNTLSDLRRYDEADAAYEAGLAVAEANRASLLVNRANLLDRRGRVDDALAVLDACEEDARKDRGLLRHLEALRVHLLNKAGRFAEARDRGQAALSARGRAEDGWGPVQGELARALWEGFRDADGASRAALDALEDTLDPIALTVLRRIRGEATATGGLWLIVVEGVLPLDPQDRRFFRSYQVVADTPEEALAMIAPMEPEAAPTLRIDESRRLQDTPGALKGVCHRDGYAFFDESPE
ncbi:MAG: hypothetical protein NDI82_11860, partial [Anaeromyxobacteraceae bacterium]|nr:hypothetical protein [Anaeromyxobacteraceae bacterium]